MKSSSAAAVTPFPQRAPAPRKADTEFLPAALEIVETPASPAGRAIALSVVALVALAAGWACFGKVDIVATAQGSVIPSGKSKVIQPFDVGVVRSVRVNDGDIVKAGDVLVELDPTADASDETKLRHGLAQDELDIARLRALAGPKGSSLEVPAGADERMLAVAQAHMTAQSAEQAAKLSAIDGQIAQKQAESREVSATLAKIKDSLPLISEQRDIRGALLKNEFGSRLQYLQIQQQVVEAQHELDAQTERQNEIGHALDGLSQQRAATDAEYRKGVLTDLAKAEQQASEHREEIAKAAKRRELRTLTAPVDGTVEEMTVHTLGGVVTPAEKLMVIVPKSSTLELEAMLPNADAGFVHAGQDVAVKIEAFDFTRYGLLHGTVTSVSRDAVTMGGDKDRRSGGDAKGGDAQKAQSVYVARIALAESSLVTEQGVVGLEPGMSAIAEIKTGRRTIIDYLLSPLQRRSSESLHER